MRLICISDTHEKHKDLGELPPGDVLVHAGDMTGVGNDAQLRKVASWLRAQPHRHKVVIPGNHDIGIERKQRLYVEKVFTGLHLLIDSGVTLDGVRFWGSPWTPKFFNWAYMRSEEALYSHWMQRMPEDLDVFVVHGPPYSYCDATEDLRNIGSTAQRRVLNVKRPRLVVCGHNHAGRGWAQDDADGPMVVNAAVLNERYKLVHGPICVDYDTELRRVISVESCALT